jgi:hypothetical protein
MIPEDKKHIISVYERYREYQEPILKESKFDKGFTFQRAGMEVIQGKEEEEEKGVKKFVTDNYYFTQTVFETLPNGEDVM